jgi:hypothetical protein
MTPFLTRVRLVILVSASLFAGSATAQTTPARDIFVGWAPAFIDTEYHILPAWAVSVAGKGSVAPVFDAGGWYFCCFQNIHNFLGGIRFRSPATDGPRPFAQVLAGTSIFHAGGTAAGFAFVPGGGVDVPIAGHALAIRVQGDYFGVLSPGDYGRYYWDHVWRLSTGVVLPF